MKRKTTIILSSIAIVVILTTAFIESEYRRKSFQAANENQIESSSESSLLDNDSFSFSSKVSSQPSIEDLKEPSDEYETIILSDGELKKSISALHDNTEVSQKKHKETGEILSKSISFITNSNDTKSDTISFF